MSGDVGIGKTTVLDLFRARLAQGEPVRLAQGQCVESYGEQVLYERLGTARRLHLHRHTIKATGQVNRSS